MLAVRSYTLVQSITSDSSAVSKKEIVGRSVKHLTGLGKCLGRYGEKLGVPHGTSKKFWGGRCIFEQFKPWLGLNG